MLKSSSTRSDAAPPQATFRTSEMLKQAAPTNTWFASLMFEPWSHPLIAHPLSYRPTPAGFEISAPSPKISELNTGMMEVDWPHSAQLTVSAVDFQPDNAKLAGFGDWHVHVSMAHGADELKATIAHGSPYSYYRLSRGDARIRLSQDAQNVTMLNEQSVRFQVGQQWYAVFAPQNGKLAWNGARELVLRMGSGASYFSVAALPDATESSFNNFAQHAFAFIQDTRVSWHYNADKSELQSHFEATTQTMQGTPSTTLLGLYPHHWQHSQDKLLGAVYPSVRGPIKLVASNSFDTVLPYRGIVPLWPTLAANQGGERLSNLIKGDVAKTPRSFGTQGNGTYWMGKGFGRAAQLMNIAQAQSDEASASQIQQMLQARMQEFFSGDNSRRYFALDNTIGTLAGYPEEYWSVSHMNDHHFHYGYWIHAAALIALRDPSWARPENWGGMVNLLIADIANDQRGSAQFPYLRNFDPYEGHSWASGDATMNEGNNQESSSEAINAWAGLIFWGSATGNERLRDLGIALFATESESIRQYWYDEDKLVFDPRFKREVAAQVFGSKYSFNTWWTQNPREIQGINLLPITTASTYLATNPKKISDFFVGLQNTSNMYAASGHSDGTSADIWQDVLNEYLALQDPDKAFAQWRDQGSVEGGDSRSHAFYWLKSLQVMGTPDLSVSANVPLYAVFKTAQGHRTYIACNPSDKELAVFFSDGTRLSVTAHSLLTRKTSGTDTKPDDSVIRLLKTQ